GIGLPGQLSVVSGVTKSGYTQPHFGGFWFGIINLDARMQSSKRGIMGRLIGQIDHGFMSGQISSGPIIWRSSETLSDTRISRVYEPVIRNFSSNASYGLAFAAGVLRPLCIVHRSLSLIPIGRNLSPILNQTHVERASSLR